MFSNCVDLVNPCAARDQQPIERLKIFERNVRVKRLLDQGRASAREKEENQRAFIAGPKQVQDGAARGKASRIRHGVASQEGAKAFERLRRRRWGDDNSFGAE